VTEHHTAAVKPFGSREAGTEGHNHQTQDSGNTKISDTTACLAASASTTTGLSLDRLRAPVKTGTLHGHLVRTYSLRSIEIRCASLISPRDSQTCNLWRKRCWESNVNSHL
jgi:hypothetical protein